MEWLVISLLALWFGATIAYQIWQVRLFSLVRRFDVFRVLPSWRLFPGIAPDSRLYFRDRDALGTVDLWREVPVSRSQRPWRALWNPDLLFPDAQLSYLEYLTIAVRSRSQPSAAKIRSGAAWQALWIIAAEQPLPINTVARQFEVRERPLGTTPASETTVYTSDFEPLAAK